MVGCELLRVAQAALADGSVTTVGSVVLAFAMSVAPTTASAPSGISAALARKGLLHVLSGYPSGAAGRLPGF
jgi:hypothetical protein